MFVCVFNCLREKERQGANFVRRSPSIGARVALALSARERSLSPTATPILAPPPQSSHSHSPAWSSWSLLPSSSRQIEVLSLARLALRCRASWPPPPHFLIGALSALALRGRENLVLLPPLLFAAAAAACSSEHWLAAATTTGNDGGASGKQQAT